MEESGLYTVVGFVLAVLFAIVMGLCVFAILYADFAQSGGIVNDRERSILRITAIAAASAALLAWWLQRFAATRSFGVRFFYGMLIYPVVFTALGSMMELVQKIVSKPGAMTFSFSDFYFDSLSAFYAFVIDLVGNALLPLIGLVFAAGLILAAVGPRRIY